MNLFTDSKKKQSGHVAIAAASPASQAAGQVIDQSTTLAGEELKSLAQLVQPMRSRMKEFDHALHALSIARERLRDLADLPPADMTLSVEREIAAAMGDPQALERFDAQNADALQAERSACEALMRDRQELPARILALEELVRRIAKKMVDNEVTSAIDEQAHKLFAPYAQRVMEVARQFADVMQQANAAASVLNQCLAIYEYDLYGELMHIHRSELMGEFKKNAILPQTMAGVSWQEIEAINEHLRDANAQIRQRMEQELVGANIVGERLRMYAPGLRSDDRKISSPQLTQRLKRPELSPYGVATRVLING
jgi:hypothetical protein